jgi:hypothetical protein
MMIDSLEIELRTAAKNRLKERVEFIRVEKMTAGVEVRWSDTRHPPSRLIRNND